MARPARTSKSDTVLANSLQPIKENAMSKEFSADPDDNLELLNELVLNLRW